jgi:PAS domain S-box-containing protein
MSEIGLGAAQLAALFPFHIGIGADLRIVQVGSAWARIGCSVAVGASVAECFRLVRPQLALTADALQRVSGSLVVLTCTKQGLPLRGQVLPCGAPGQLLFVGSPVISEVSDLARFGLSLDDWPAHDPVSDFLLLLQSKDVALSEARALSARLAQQGAELREAARQREQAQAELVAREVGLRAILDTAAEGIVTADEHGAIRSFNAAASRLFGWAPDDVIGSNVRKLMPGEVARDHAGHMARYRETGLAAIIGKGREVEGLRRDGSRFPLHLSVSEVQAPQGRTFTAILRDLTELKAAQQALEATEARTRLIVDTALDAVITIDADSIVTLWNAQAEATFGWTREEAVGRSLAELVIPPALRPAHEAGMRRYLATGEARVLNRRIEITGWHREGRAFPVELAITPLRENGRLSFSAFIRDISDRKRAEQLLRVQYEVTRILAADADLSDVAPALLRAISEYIGWSMAACWILDEAAGVLRCVDAWHEPSLQTGSFLDETRRLEFAPGVGLPGRVLASGEYLWLPTVADDPNFPRASSARAEGLASGFALPIEVHGRVEGVIEFFSRAYNRPAADVVSTLASLAAQIGQFLERRRAQQAVRDGRERLELALEGADLGTWDLHLPTGTATVNERYLAMLGYARGEVEPNLGTWSHYIHPDDLGAVLAAFKAHLRGHTPAYETEHRLRHRTGDWIWVLDRGRVIERDAQGRAVRACGTHLDISARKRAELAQRRSEVQLRSVVDNMLEGLVVFSEDLRIVQVNAAFARMFGYQPDELHGRRPAELWPDRRGQGGDGRAWRDVRGLLGKVLERDGLRRTGEVFPVQLHLSEASTPDGVVIVGHARDFSHEREADLIKKRFVASVSHELRTPLTAIRGSLGLLALGGFGTLPPEARDVLEIAERNATRLTGIINDLLDFERIQAGLLLLVRARVPVDRAIARAVESVHALAQESGIRVEAAPVALDVWGDEERIIQVVVNLLGNAIKFSPAGETVTVAGEACGGEVRVSVSDRGRGVPESLRDVIFQPFRQVEESDTRRHGGSGLGLAICRAIVDQHGGRIGVEAGPGGGSVFWFTMPLAPEGASAAAD